MDVTAAAIASVVSTFVATSVTLRINKSNKKKVLEDQLDSILKIAIQHPYLESTLFTETWTVNKNSTAKKYLRYEIYCNLVFNYMERLCDYYNYNERKISKHINLKDWIRVHKQCWENPSAPFENADGYPEKLKALLTKYLN